MRWIAGLVIASWCATARPARAEPWYRGEDGERRLTHLAFAAGAGALYGISESIAKSALAPDDCRWCGVNALDDDVRSLVLWDDPGRAATLSNVAVVAAPVLVVGWTALASRVAGPGARAGRFVDDLIPVVETFFYGELVVQAVKFSFGRQRPFVRFNTDPAFVAAQDDNVSFFSAHAYQTFSLAVSAGVVAHRRGSSVEPVIWATGLGVAAATSYLRLAADKHYLTDVLGGAAWGTAAALVIPRLSRALPRQVTVVPDGTGVAVLGQF